MKIPSFLKAFTALMLVTVTFAAYHIYASHKWVRSDKQQECTLRDTECLEEKEAGKNIPSATAGSIIWDSFSDNLLLVLF